MMQPEAAARYERLLEVYAQRYQNEAEAGERLRDAQQDRHEALRACIDFVSQYAAASATTTETSFPGMPLTRADTLMMMGAAAQRSVDDLGFDTSEREAVPFPIPGGIVSEAVLERVAADAIHGGQGIMRLKSDDGVKVERIAPDTFRVTTPDPVPLTVMAGDVLTDAPDPDEGLRGARFCQRTAGCIHYAGHSGLCKLEPMT